MEEHLNSKALKQFSLVQSNSAMTHSYIIMPIISAEGNLLSPLYIVHQEHIKDGYFGTNIKKHLLEFLKNKINILVSSSKSGKMEKKAL